jgi:hypothetical protein
MAAVADTSPLILLAKIDRLTLLPELYHEVFIPPAVAMELQAKPDALSPELHELRLGSNLYLCEGAEPAAHSDFLGLLDSISWSIARVAVTQRATMPAAYGRE